MPPRTTFATVQPMRLFLVFALVACTASSRGPAGPAWPQPAAHDADGGESLAPRPAARAIAAIVEERPADRAAADKSAPAASPSTGDRAAAASATAPTEELT